jgi:hypothetical protein
MHRCSHSQTMQETGLLERRRPSDRVAVKMLPCGVRNTRLNRRALLNVHVKCARRQTETEAADYQQKGE